MRLVMLVPLAALLPGAGSPAAPAPTPIGKFRTWLGYDRKPLHLVSGGVTVDVEALPCPPHAVSDSTCDNEGYNNQATITVTAPGLAPIAMTSDRQASFVRVAVVRLDRRDTRPGVIVDNQWGGSGGITRISFIQPVASGFREVAVQRRSDERELQGQIADFPRDLSGDGIVDVVLEDSLAYRYVCNGCTPRLPLVLSVVGGHSVDLSGRPALRPFFARDMVRWRARCLLNDSDQHNDCAAYLADAARAGRFAQGWRDMLRQHLRGGELWQDCTAARDGHGTCPAGQETRYRTFPESLRAFLVVAGYITAAQAAAAPLS